MPDKFYLYVGSVIERKNLLNICKALLLIKEKNKIPLLVIGDGSDYMQQVYRFVKENGLQQWVFFLSNDPEIKCLQSYKSAIDFPAIYQQALCMIYPSFFEGFGIPVLEGMWLFLIHI